MTRTEITIAGVGGQGSILAGVMLGKAAVAYDGKFATQTQAYSSELRGGFAAAWVVISDGPVEYPRVIRPDILVAQAQDSIDRFAASIRDGGILIMDEDMITKAPDHGGPVFRVPATSIARNEIKEPVTANIVMLGAFCKCTSLVARKALETAIAESVPKGKEGKNMEAFRLGYERVTGH
ncbi:MAG TPA: 2-oxoacid:acceptor oxidoreductase family protein [Desulfosarcina sp.]|nr:2-oxoacid:acceptor oxidoreductase family protein [Desulfosarcina sp.]